MALLDLPAAFQPKRKRKHPNGPAGYGDWRDLLITNREGKPKALMANAEIALRESAEWGGRLAYDAFAQDVWDRRQEQYWTDIDDLVAAKWMQHNGIFVGPTVVQQTTELVASQHSFHPMRTYLSTLA